MYVFLNEIAWNQKLNQIPLALREKFVAGFEELGANLGIDCLASDTGWMQISFSSPQGLFQWMDEAGIVAVELEPADIPALMGRGFDALVLKRGMDRGEVNFGRLLPEEIMTNVREAAWSLQATTSEATQLDTELAQFDLKAAGLMSQADFLEPAEPERFHGFHSSPNDASAIPEEFKEAPSESFDPFL
jgi:hypothetical protein